MKAGQIQLCTPVRINIKNDVEVIIKKIDDAQWEIQLLYN